MEEFMIYKIRLFLPQINPFFVILDFFKTFASSVLVQIRTDKQQRNKHTKYGTP